MCSLNKTTIIINIQSIQAALTVSEDIPSLDDSSTEAWNNAWDEDLAEEKLSDALKLKKENQSWLQNCISSLSPRADILALGYGQNAVFFTCKCDLHPVEKDIFSKFVVSYEGKLATEKGETLKSLLCLPLASQKKSFQGSPDWTCIVVGFSSGYIRIYTENGEELLSQKLHDEPIGHLRCKTRVPQHFSNYADQPDELVIVFSTVVVVIDGFGLFQTLRACRNQLARAVAGRQEVIQPPPLSYKKWGFHEHDKLLDCEAAGVMNVSSFDHLVTESIRKGFYGAVKTNVPTNSLLLTTGCNPYVGYYHASEGSGQLLLTDVVQAVASKLMNFISYNAGGLMGNLMSFNQPKDQKPQTKIEPATILPLRFGLYDKRRQGLSISLSPNKCLAVITDAFGRVILFDVFKGVAVRMWKGYRDAQCGWVEADDAVKAKDPNADNKKPRRVFFLVIYAPRRGILEVWCTQQGPRVAAFNVGKTGRLFCPGYAMVGCNFNSPGLREDLCSCYFLDIDGILRKVEVPFYLVLSEKNSRRARDLHLLRELKLTLKNSAKGKTFEIIKILRDMKTSCTRIQAFENVLSNCRSTEDLVQEVVTALLTHLRKQDPLQTDHEAKLLQQSCLRALQLLKLYSTVSRINSKPSKPPSDDSSVDVQMYSTSLCISETEVGRILSLVTLHQTIIPILKRQVRFSDDNPTDLSLSDFFSCFVVHDSHLVKNGEDIVLENLSVDLNAGVSTKQAEGLGGFLFHSFIHVGESFSTLQVALKDSGIFPDKLLLLLLKHWVSDAGFCSSAEKWINLQQVMKHISSLSDPKLVSSDSDHLSPWWSSIREALVKATGNVAAYIGAIVARSVSVIMAASFHVEHKKHKRNKSSDDKAEVSGEESGSDSDWEDVSLDLEYWNLLVKQLEDVLMLNILLKSQPYGKAAVKDVNISIDMILSGGQGSVTDLLSVWAVSVGMEPEILSSFLVDKNSDEFMPQKRLEEKSDNKSLIMVKGMIGDLKKKFPCSLNHDVLLSNCAWEHLMQWSKNKDSVNHLDLSMKCLNLVNSSVIRNGFACMMWKTCVLKTFEPLALLMEKVGKTPKERLCRKDLEMSDVILEDFLNFCTELLSAILETNIPSEMEQMPKFPAEHFWQGHENSGRTPLIFMALSQKASNNHLVYIHFMLATMLHIIVTFQLKSVKPFALFSLASKKNFFHDIHHPIQEQTEKEDQGMKTARSQFLFKAASAVAQSLPETVPEASESRSTCLSSINQTDYSSASRWFSNILDLGRSWELDLDEIRRHYVCELYSSGQDLLANEIKTAVTDQPLLSSQLLMLAGQRVHKVIFESSDPARTLGVLTPDVSSFIRSLGDMKLRCNNVPLLQTLTLLDEILAYLPENSKEQKLAFALKSALRDLSKMESTS